MTSKSFSNLINSVFLCFCYILCKNYCINKLFSSLFFLRYDHKMFEYQLKDHENRKKGLGKKPQCPTLSKLTLNQCPEYKQYNEEQTTLNIIRIISCSIRGTAALVWRFFSTSDIIQFCNQKNFLQEKIISFPVTQFPYEFPGLKNSLIYLAVFIFSNLFFTC